MSYESTTTEYYVMCEDGKDLNVGGTSTFGMMVYTEFEILIRFLHGKNRHIMLSTVKTSLRPVGN